MKENHQVFEIYNLLNSQFVHDFNALELVFQLLDLKMTRSEALLLFKKLTCIHKILVERDKGKHGC